MIIAIMINTKSIGFLIKKGHNEGNIKIEKTINMTAKIAHIFIPNIVLPIIASSLSP